MVYSELAAWQSDPPRVSWWLWAAPTGPGIYGGLMATLTDDADLPRRTRERPAGAGAVSLNVFTSREPPTDP